MNKWYNCSFFILLSFALLLPFSSFGKHLIGGEVAYECLGNGDYEITLSVYRDCLGGGANFDVEAAFSIYQCGPTIDCSLLEQGSQGFNFRVPLLETSLLNSPDPTCVLPQICVEQGIYRFRLSDYNAFLPNIENSYHVVYQRCCRNETITNLTTPGDIGSTFTIEITPEAQQLCNTSPVFEGFPPVITCANEPFSFPHIAADAEGDSLVYAFASPLAGGGPELANGPNRSCFGIIPTPACPPPYDKVAFISSLYTANQPFGTATGTIQIDAATGLLEGVPSLVGQFVAGVSVSEYRNGVLLSVTQREFQVNVVDCMTGNARVGTPCDDGNTNTENDQIQENCACAGTVKPAIANAVDLFFSEYMEGATNNKCLEIFNPFDSAVDLTNQYAIKVFRDGSKEGRILKNLTGTIAPKSTYLVCYDASDAAILELAATTFDEDIDGNDAISLEKNNTLIDVFGNIGCDPGEAWANNSIGISTKDKTLIRCPCVATGIKANPSSCDFPTLTGEWICFPTDDVNNLGMHSDEEEGTSVVHFFAETYCDCQMTCRERDSLVLVDIYTATNGENWTNTWDLTLPIDRWYGITLTEEGCVKDINLCEDCICPNCDGNNLNGTLPNSIGDLSELETFAIVNNPDLTGTIPTTIGKLKKTRFFTVEANNMIGELPVELGLMKDLRDLRVSNNQFNGNIPTELGAAPDLSRIFLNNNSFTGSIPSELFNLTIVWLDLSNNQLNGAIPEQIGDLVALQTLLLNDNNLSGCFPTNLNQVCYLTDSLIRNCAADISELEGCQYDFRNNPLLPWEGDFSMFCNTTSQVNAPCNDGDVLTLRDAIQEDCTCQEMVQVQNTAPNDTVIFSFLPQDTTVEINAAFCLKVIVHNFTNISEVQYTLTWDSTLLAYSNIEDFGLTGIPNVNFSTANKGVLQFSWKNTGPAGFSLEDGSMLYAVCFTALQAGTTPVDFSGEPLPIIIRDDNQEQVPFIGNPATVTIEGEEMMVDSECTTINNMGIFAPAINTTACEDGTVLSINVPPDFTGKWATTAPEVIIDDPTSSITTIRNLQTGITAFTWSLDTINCTTYESTTVNITRLGSPSLTRDVKEFDNTIQGYHTFRVVPNDNVAPTVPYVLEVVDPISEGTLEHLGEGRFEYTPPTDYTGKATFSYQVCYQECRTLCDETTVELTITKEALFKDDGFVPNAITPNGDGLNDYFVIQELIDTPEKYPNNELLVFNRWGDVLYSVKPYANNWGGTNQTGAPLPEATYYYVLRLDINQAEILRGEITILR